MLHVELLYMKLINSIYKTDCLEYIEYLKNIWISKEVTTDLNKFPNDITEKSE